MRLRARKATRERGGTDDIEEILWPLLKGYRASIGDAIINTHVNIITIAC